MGARACFNVRHTLTNIQRVHNAFAVYYTTMPVQKHNVVLYPNNKTDAKKVMPQIDEFASFPSLVLD